MEKIIIGVVLVAVVVVILLSLKKKNKPAVTETEENKESKLNQADVNMMRNINAGGFAAREVQASDIKVPDFKKDEPIGYKDTSHILNNTGDHIANTANQDNTK